MLDLQGFTGTEAYHKIDHFSGHVVTDGVLEMAEKLNAHWLATDILINQKHIPSLKGQPFITWKLKAEKAGAILTADDGNNNILYTQDYYVTDFPFSEVQSSLSDKTTFVMFFSNGVLLLPSEN